FGLDPRDARLPNAPQRFNAAPTQDLLVIRRNPDSAQAEMGLLRWGLVPSFSKDMSGAARLINARSETVQEKAVFRGAWAKGRRCVVPADAFYEWQRTPDGKQPYAIARANGAPLALAGLWENWRDPASGEWVRTFTILTCAANPRLAPLHDRMPVILDPADIPAWLAGPDPAPLLRPLPAEAVTLWPVSTRVNSVRNDDESLLMPLADEPLAPEGTDGKAHAELKLFDR
ncbi:MAG: hypothetical protein B7Z15_07010, partial [Rhizobiales bacterium 32-66-8]